MKNELQLQGAMGGTDPMPTSPDPVDPGRSDLDPDTGLDVDDVPVTEGDVPLDPEDEDPLEDELAEGDAGISQTDDPLDPR